MYTVNPSQAILNDGLPLVNFFNGRLLTGEDLTQEQSATRTANWRLGQALGAGIASGLWVSADKLNDNTATGLMVKVTAGLAVNREGQVLRLAQEASVAVVEAAAATTAAGRLFSECVPAGDGVFTSSPGLYLLALAPAEGASLERSPVSGLGNTQPTCNNRYLVEGVQFRLIRLKQTGLDPDAYLRNALAYLCFGIAAVEGALAAPFASPPETYGFLETQSPPILDRCDVPLAVIYRASSGIQFVDNWSVRRRVTAPTADPAWHIHLGDHRRSLGEAAFLQFQEHLAALVKTESNLPNLSADKYFKYLPPSGFLPTAGGQISWQVFLGAHAPPAATDVEIGLLPGILGQALQSQPFAVNGSPLVALDVYRVLDKPGFVLFARSSLGRVKIALSPAPPAGLSVDLHARAPERDNLAYAVQQPAAGGLLLPSLPPGGYKLSGSVPGYEPVTNETITAVGGRVTAKTIALTPLPPGQVLLTVENPEGERLTSQMQSVTASVAGAAVGSGVLKDTRWLIDDLPAGTYDLTVTATGYEQGELKNVEVQSGQETQKTLVLAREITFPLCLVVETVDELKLDHLRMCLVFSAVLVAIKNRGAEGAKIGDFFEIGPGMLGDAAMERLIEWQAMIHDLSPALGVDQVPPQLFISREHRPVILRQEIPQTPMAYFVLGDISIPLTIVDPVDPDQGPTPLPGSGGGTGQPLRGKLGIVEAEGKIATNSGFTSLRIAGITTVDQLAGAWVELISAVTGGSPADSEKLIRLAIRYMLQNDLFLTPGR